MSRTIATIDSNQLAAGDWSLNGFAAGTDGFISLTSTELAQVAGGYFKELGAKWGGTAAQSLVAAGGVAAASTPWGRGAAMAGWMGYKMLPRWAQAGIAGAGVAAWDTIGHLGSQAGGYLGEKLDNALGNGSSSHPAGEE